MSEPRFPPCPICGHLTFHSQDCAGHGGPYGTFSGSYGSYGSSGAAETPSHHLQRAETGTSVRAENVELYAKNRALSAEVEALRAENARLTKERDGAQANYRFVVERAADAKLDGYRELGARAADAENKSDALRARIQKLEGALKQAEELARTHGALWGLQCHCGSVYPGVQIADAIVISKNAIFAEWNAMGDMPSGFLAGNPAPAPKTFTVEDVQDALKEALRGCDPESPELAAVIPAFRRSLGLKDGEG